MCSSPMTKNSDFQIGERRGDPLFPVTTGAHPCRTLPRGCPSFPIARTRRKRGCDYRPINSVAFVERLITRPKRLCQQRFLRGHDRFFISVPDDSSPCWKARAGKPELPREEPLEENAAAFDTVRQVGENSPKGARRQTLKTLRIKALAIVGPLLLAPVGLVQGAAAPLAQEKTPSKQPGRNRNRSGCGAQGTWPTAR